MNCINNPTLFTGLSSILMAPIMAIPAKRGKQTVVAKVAPISSCLVMNVLTLRLFAFLAHWMQCQVSFLNLCILIVFALALGGCIPQPSAALEALRSF